MQRNMGMVSPVRTSSTSSSAKDYDHLFKILIIGDSGVGKSSLLLRFTADTYTECYTSTIGVDYVVKTLTQPNGKRVKLQMWDTAGQERFKTMTAGYYRGANGIVMVYDACNPRSFNRIKEWLAEVSKNTTEDTVKILVGNKCDSERGLDLAKSMKVHFIECSAKLGTNVDEIFHLITQELIASRKRSVPLSEVKEIPIKPEESNIVHLHGPTNITKKREGACTCRLIYEY